MNKIISEANQTKQNLVVISSYPPYGTIHGDKVAGVASYTKNTLLSLQKLYSNLRITVLAEQFEKSKKNYYEEDLMQVKRIWKRNSLSLFVNLFKEIVLNHQDAKKIVIELEFAMFGGLIYILPLPLFLITLKLLKKEIIFVSHQVAPDLNELHGHLNLNKDSLKALFFNLLIRSYYKTVMYFSHKTIVFEDTLQKKLQKISRGNVVVIPHGVQKFNKSHTKQEARKILGLPQNQFIVVSFGFIAWYKGSDWLVDVFTNIAKETKYKNTLLVLAGGPNTNHVNQAYYEKYLRQILLNAQNENIIVTGFVPESKIALYYQAADVIAFPYRTFMSASGSLALAFSFHKPVLLAHSLQEMLKTTDIKEILAQGSLEKDTLLFTSQKDFLQKLSAIRNNGKIKRGLVAFSKKVAQARNWNIIATRYYEEIFSTHI